MYMISQCSGISSDINSAGKQRVNERRDDRSPHNRSPDCEDGNQENDKDHDKYYGKSLRIMHGCG